MNSLFYVTDDADAADVLLDAEGIGICADCTGGCVERFSDVMRVAVENAQHDGRAAAVVAAWCHGEISETLAISLLPARTWGRRRTS